MTKISKQTLLKAILEYTAGTSGKLAISKKYGIAYMKLNMYIAAYQTHGSNVVFKPPKIDTAFRINVASWAISHNASYTQVAAKFGYTGLLQIQQWKHIYSQKGPNGLLSIKKGRNPKIPKKPANKLNDKDNRLVQLEDEILRLQIENEALKLLASMKQQTNNLQQLSANSRRNSD
ncbi:helix-turn-helix domain-containing protein [Leuconostoc falkenbergense]|uniref:helix-turn-helix domain-containing protein n=1 Tax=Leuconostoc falkenbergense TaxID=2766470 RepID=UPI0024AE2335|nr:helix-turn-helix domain-containing protein [Leuconostoc falkenbergense]MDI6666113.1 helix-turn-helix domain-containing protein [Leuconostoc falkenbergense]